jgi:hypothetical protein
MGGMARAESKQNKQAAPPATMALRVACRRAIPFREKKAQLLALEATPPFTSFAGLGSTTASLELGQRFGRVAVLGYARSGTPSRRAQSQPAPTVQPVSVDEKALQKSAVARR